MINNLNRIVADAPLTQQKLNFGKTQNVQTTDQSSVRVAASQGFIECRNFSFKIVKYQSNCQVESFELFENNDPKPKPVFDEIKEAFICQEHLMVFAYKHTLKRHLLKQHQDNQNIYFKHGRVNMLVPLVKKPIPIEGIQASMVKKHYTEFQVIDAETKQLIPAKRKS